MISCSTRSSFDLLTQHAHQQLVVNGVEILAQTNIDDSPIALTVVFLRLQDCLMRVPPRSKSETVFREVTFQNQLQHLRYRLLNHPIHLRLVRRAAARHHPVSGFPPVLPIADGSFPAADSPENFPCVSVYARLRLSRSRRDSNRSAPSFVLVARLSMLRTPGFSSASSLSFHGQFRCRIFRFPHMLRLSLTKDRLLFGPSPFGYYGLC